MAMPLSFLFFSLGLLRSLQGDGCASLGTSLCLSLETRKVEIFKGFFQVGPKRVSILIWVALVFLFSFLLIFSSEVFKSAFFKIC